MRVFTINLAVALTAAALNMLAGQSSLGMGLLSAPQDNCEIGSVSHERYREIVAEVEALPRIDWRGALARSREIERERERLRPRFSNTPEERELWSRAAALPDWEEVLEAALTEGLRQAMSGSAELDEKVARMHSLLRREGAVYSFTSASPNAPVPKTIPDLWGVAYRYNIDTWRIGLWRPVFRGAAAVVRLTQTPNGMDLDYAALIIPQFENLDHTAEPAPNCPRTPEELVRLQGGMKGPPPLQ